MTAKLDFKNSNSNFYRLISNTLFKEKAGRKFAGFLLFHLLGITSQIFVLKCLFLILIL